MPILIVGLALIAFAYGMVFFVNLTIILAKWVLLGLALYLIWMEIRKHL